MLYLYRNGLGEYEVIKEVEGKEVVIYKGPDISVAEQQFNYIIEYEKKTTLLKYDGTEIKDYRT